MILVAALLCAASTPVAFQTPGVLSLTLSPTTIAGGSGDSSTGTVTLNAPAAAGGVVVTLASSNIELAATLPSVTVPAGATSAAFTVATNANYRAYSGLAFSAVISASHPGSTRSATLQVTAQPEPPDFTSGSQGGANTQWSGSMCGGIAPIGGRQGILYRCSPASGTGFGTCTFQQECSLGCRRVPPSGSTFNDFCATSGPNSVAISRNYIVSGDRVPASIVAEAPAGQAQDREQGVPSVIDPNFNATYFPHAGGIGFPTGATSVSFDVATSYVPAIQFADVVGFWFNASIPPLLITNGRAGHAWLVMVPPDPPPAVAIPTLGDFFVSGINPIIGGEITIGQIDVSGLSRVGGPTITLTSSHPAIVPSTSIVAPATENFLGFQVPIATQAPAVDTDVTITATDGRYRFSSVLRVLTPPPAPVLSAVSVNPTSVGRRQFRYRNRDVERSTKQRDNRCALDPRTVDCGDDARQRDRAGRRHQRQLHHKHPAGDLAVQHEHLRGSGRQPRAAGASADQAGRGRAADGFDAVAQPDYRGRRQSLDRDRDLERVRSERRGIGAALQQRECGCRGPQRRSAGGRQECHVQDRHQKHRHRDDDGHCFGVAWRHDANRLADGQSAATAAARRDSQFLHGQPGQRHRRQSIDRHRAAVGSRAVRRCPRQPGEQSTGLGQRAPECDRRRRSHERQLHRDHVQRRGDDCSTECFARGRDPVHGDHGESGRTDGDVGGDRDGPKRSPGDVEPGGDQCDRREYRLGVVQGGKVNHAHGVERPRCDLVGRLFERRKQEEIVHVHVERQRGRHRQRALTPPMRT